ncbi:GTP cyclohydrolase I FolE [Phaeodactylibacter luteus]|uniref:GTP cyclohydrolase 1 n=1 Tax=Phaeodactylibacter luteus TaxID=1564516 RepID=A0A5C6RMD7_9BACT|nr:GTP cyclohydrolase I FolE [Phaeodactylibacter luteus]TXB63571.1 GTP cyclohydrolase I FolE [Phaeodactylibacter luteus]
MINSKYQGNGNGAVVNGHARSNGHAYIHDMGDAHAASSAETPLRPDAFDLSDEEKMEEISRHFRAIMETLGLDLTDDSLNGTPRRVAKMFVKEIFGGLHPDAKPSISLFENKFGYRQMLVEKGIRVQSFCEHHFLPITGKCHVAYIANGQVIGLSKLNRIVEYYARRPQVQERLTVQIANELKKVLRTEDIAVYIDASHMCVEMRGIKHTHCSTVTTEYGGKFLNENTRNEFLQAIKGELK